MAHDLDARLLARVPLLHHLSPGELERLAAEMCVVELSDGALLFHEGDVGEGFYIILEGQLEIVQALHTVDERVAVVRCPGEFVGEMSLLNPDGLRTASVRARGATRLWEMTRAQFEDLIRNRPSLAYEMARTLSGRLSAAQQQTIEDLTAKNRELRQAYDDLKAAQAQLVEKERLERELQVAHDIQMSVLPGVLPELAGFEFGACMVPARAVGGDFYDFMPLDDDRLGIAVGDVSGKGVPAALFMTQVQALLHARADGATPPAEVLDWVNRQLVCRGGSGLFVTALYGILDRRNGAFAYARAGHEPPILRLPSGETDTLPFGVGQPLGLWDGSLVDEQQVELPPGGLLVLHTDGATDARDIRGEPFGHERFVARVAALDGLPPRELCQRLWQDLVSYQGEVLAYDDVTLVAIRRL